MKVTKILRYWTPSEVPQPSIQPLSELQLGLGTAVLYSSHWKYKYKRWLLLLVQPCWLTALWLRALFGKMFALHFAIMFSERENIPILPSTRAMCNAMTAVCVRLYGALHLAQLRLYSASQQKQQQQLGPLFSIVEHLNGKYNALPLKQIVFIWWIIRCWAF